MTTQRQGDLLAPRDFFVSIRRGDRVAFLAGPFTTHGAALEMVDAARSLACELDAWADFDAFGTCSIPAGSGKRGGLNEKLSIKVDSSHSRA